jgi:hypothetical protein
MKWIGAVVEKPMFEVPTTMVPSGLPWAGSAAKAPGPVTTALKPSTASSGGFPGASHFPLVRPSTGVASEPVDGVTVKVPDGTAALATPPRNAAPPAVTVATRTPDTSRVKNLLRTNFTARTLRLEGEQAMSGARPGDCDEPHRGRLKRSADIPHD